MAQWSRPQELVGETLGGSCKLLRLLGEGATGAVYEGRRLGTEVAVKVLASSFSSEPSARQRFLRDAQAASRIRSQHAVRILDVGEEPVPFFVMELLGGRDLAQVLAEDGPLPWKRVKAITRQVVHALFAAGLEGIVHRDLEPGNVFVAPGEDGSDFVKVTDFGIGGASEATLETRGITRTNETESTAAYRSPEQITGGAIDARTDMYALGVVIFELVAGRLPFDGATAYELMEQHVRKEPPRLRQVAPSAPYELEELVLRCMAKEPAKRFPTIEALAQAIEAIPDAASNLRPPSPAFAPSAPAPAPGPGAAPPSLASMPGPTPAPDVPSNAAASVVLPPMLHATCPVAQAVPPAAQLQPTEVLDGFAVRLALGENVESTEKLPDMTPPPPVAVARARPPADAAPVQSAAWLPESPAPRPRREDFTITMTAGPSAGKVVAFGVLGVVVAIGAGIGVAALLGVDLGEDEETMHVAADKDEPRAKRAPNRALPEEPDLAEEPEPPADPELVRLTPTPVGEPDDPEQAAEEPVELADLPVAKPVTRPPKSSAAKNRDISPVDRALGAVRKKARSRCKHGLIGDQVVVSFVLRPDGGTSLVQPNPPNQRSDAGRCIADLVRGTRFPPGNDGRRTLTVYF